MSLVQVALVLLFAALSSNAFELECQPPGVTSRFFHLQDVSPDMAQFIEMMRSGALQEFSDWAHNLFTPVSTSLAYFNEKHATCWGLERGFDVSPIVGSYASMVTSVGSNTPERGVMDAIVHAASANWNAPLAQGRRVIFVYTNKVPSYPPTAGYDLFDPNNFDCAEDDTPSMAELTTFMNTSTHASIFVVFVVPDNLVNSYRSAFAWMGSRLSVVPAGSDKDTLLNEGLFAAMNEIYCGIDPPTSGPKVTNAVTIIEPTTTTTATTTTTFTLTTTATKSCSENTVLQLLHLQDFSWSYTNDMEHLKAKMPALLAALETGYYERRVALGTFVDKDMPNSGYWTDYCYREDSTFSADGALFINALNAATIRSGRDWRESQYDAIRDGLQSTTLGWITGNSVGDKHLLRVVMLATDAGPHKKGDQPSLPATHPDGCAFADYPSHADIKALLETYDVYPIFVVTNDMYNYYNHLLNNQINATGKVLRLADTVTDIIDGIQVALEDLCNEDIRRLSNH